MESVVNILGTLTAIVAALLLYRGYGRTRRRLLLWAALCFLALAIENGILFVDRFIVPETDLVILRYIVAAVGIASLTFGLVWEAT